MDQNLSVGIDRPTIIVHKAVGVIRVDMGEDDMSDIRGIDSSCLQIGRQLAERRLHRVAGANVDEHGRSVTLEEETVDWDKERAIGRFTDKFLGLSSLHAEDKIERGLQDTIAEALHLETADTKYLC